MKKFIVKDQCFSVVGTASPLSVPFKKN